MSTSSFNTWGNASFNNDNWGPGRNKSKGPVAPSTEDLTDPMEKDKWGMPKNGSTGPVAPGSGDNNEEERDKDNNNDNDRGSRGTRMAGSDGFKNNLERKLGTEEYQRIGAEGLQDADNRGQYSAAEVKSEFRNSDKSVDEMTEYFQGLSNDGTKFNKRAQAFLQAKGVQLKNGGGSGGGGGDETGGGGDDDGDAGGGGNTGGGSGGGGGGNGSGNNNQSHAQNAIDAAAANNPVDTAKLDQRIKDRPLYNQAKSDLMTSQIFGDIWSSNFNFPDWNTDRYKADTNLYGSSSSSSKDDDDE